MYDYASSDDDYGFSDDNDFEDFKEKIRNLQNPTKDVDSEAQQKKQQLQTIFSAITYGRHEVVFEELDKGLDVNIELEHGWTPLLLASAVANETIMHGLLERGANAEQTRDTSTPLMLLCAISQNDEAMEKHILLCVKLLIQKKVNLNTCDKRRKTAIMSAATNGHLETVQLLLPLVNKEAEDNQKWDVLFWAVVGNQPKIVKMLLDQGFNSEKNDIRGDTPLDLANDNEFKEVADLFPKDPFDELYSHMTSNDLNFENTFKALAVNEKPKFFRDISKILYGTKSEYVMSIVIEKNVSLGEFLSLNYTKLEELGVKFPYQRNRVLGGIYQFHKHPFTPRSIPFVTRDQLYTNIDVATTVLTCIKQFISMEAGLKFIIENDPQKLSLAETKEVNILVAKIRQQIEKLKIITEKLVKRTGEWDSNLKPVDRITKKRRNIPWCNLCFAVGVGSLSLLIWYKFR